jgi:hypothetical protein
MSLRSRDEHDVMARAGGHLGLDVDGARLAAASSRLVWHIPNEDVALLVSRPGVKKKSAIASAIAGAADPFADHSARFPLSRANPAASYANPSEPAIRPWGLRGMRPARQQGDPVREVFAYDHELQVAVDKWGRLLINAARDVRRLPPHSG